MRKESGPLGFRAIRDSCQLSCAVIMGQLRCCSNLWQQKLSMLLGVYPQLCHICFFLETTTKLRLGYDWACLLLPYLVEFMLLGGSLLQEGFSIKLQPKTIKWAKKSGQQSGEGWPQCLFCCLLLCYWVKWLIRLLANILWSASTALRLPNSLLTSHRPATK